MNHAGTALSNSILPFLLAIAGCSAVQRSSFETAESPRVGDELDDAFAELVAADHWRTRNAARDKLAGFGEDALEVIAEGARHQAPEVRRVCHEILRDHFTTHPRSIEAIVLGLDDEDELWVAYPSAFHLGEHRIESARADLERVWKNEAAAERTRYAAAKSLGELGVADVCVTLWTGLGSDDPYTRYLSNLGMQGLAGRDLADFGYEGPWEGAFVSGPNVGRVQGQPIEKAQKRVVRWQKIVELGRWLEAERPALFAELDALW